MSTAAILCVSAVGVFAFTWLVLTVARYHQAACVMTALGATIVFVGGLLAMTELMRPRARYFDVIPALILIAIGYRAISAFLNKEVTWDDVVPPS